jgi:ubiquinol-cytochrome c reductase iron-sulfur subunit
MKYLFAAVLHLLAGVLRFVLRLLAPRRKPRAESPSRKRTDGHTSREESVEREVGAHPGAELQVAALLLLAGVLGIAFVALYVLEPDTQLLGLAFGLALAAVAVAMVRAANAVVPRGVAVQPRPDVTDAGADEQTDDALRAGVEGVSRRNLLLGASAAAAGGLGAAAAVPLASAGPGLGDEPDRTPWREGVPLVDPHGEPISADAINVGAFLTAFPRGADRRELGSPVVVVRVRPDELRLPPERAGWAPAGIMAFSKICTHAGCAVNLFRYPKHEPTSEPPGLVCPCHFSTFDVRAAAKVVFGPAARSLPQLPLTIGPEGQLVAGGGFSGPVGPSWWGVRRT